MRNLIRTLLVCQITFGLSSCYYDVQEDLHPGIANQACDTSVALYSIQIRSIMQNSCNSCHNAGNAAAGIKTDNYQDLKTIANNGTLRGSINHVSGFRPMPQNMAKLGPCELQLVDKWIREGTVNN